MKYLALPTSAIILVATVVAEKWFDYAAVEQYAICFILS
jgi:hypothetical protein